MRDKSTVPGQSGSSELAREHFSSRRLLFFIVVSVFLAEVVAMIIVYKLPPLPYGDVTLIDAGIMTLLIFPMLYLLSFRPLIRHIDRRRQAEQALRQKEELEAKFFDSLDILIAYMDRDFNFLRVNEAYAKASRHPTEYFIGKNHFVLFPHPENQLIFQKMVESGEPYFAYETPFEYLQNSQQGASFWNWRLQPVKGFNGVVEGLVLSLLDVTDRRRAEDANRQLSRIVEQTEDTVVVTNRDGVIEYANPAFERLTGYAKHEAVGKTPRVIKSDLHDHEFYQNMWHTILKGEVFQSEITNRKKSGELYHEVKTITPLRDSQGNITHFVATGKDITEHKRDEEKLLKAFDELELRIQERTEELRVLNSTLEKEISEREQAEETVRQREAMFRAVLEQMPSGVTVRDAQTGKLIFSNVRSLEILDALVEIPDQFSEYRGFHPDGRAYPNEEWPVYRSMTTGEVINAEEIECERNDGTRFMLLVSSAPVYDGEGGIANGVAVFDDITERKRAEKALQAANQELTRFNRAMVGRELRLIEMKKEVNDLCMSAGLPPRYSLDFEKDYRLER